jgi:hypothetical protein
MRIPYGRLASILLIAVLVALPSPAAAQRKAKIVMISFGDNLENKSWIKNYKQHLHTKVDIEESFRGLKEKGFSVIYWRKLFDGAALDEIEKYSYRLNAETAQLRNEFEGTPYA